jgi:hypothetical protein
MPIRLVPHYLRLDSLHTSINHAPTPLMQHHSATVLDRVFRLGVGVASVALDRAGFLALGVAGGGGKSNDSHSDESGAGRLKPLSATEGAIVGREGMGGSSGTKLGCRAVSGSGMVAESEDEGLGWG